MRTTTIKAKDGDVIFLGSMSKPRLWPQALALLVIFVICMNEARANPGQGDCARLKDVYENIGNRSYTNEQAAVGMNAEAHRIGVPVGASDATKCASILTQYHDRLKAEVRAHKESVRTPENSSEVD